MLTNTLGRLFMWPNRTFNSKTQCLQLQAGNYVGVVEMGMPADDAEGADCCTGSMIGSGQGW